MKKLNIIYLWLLIVCLGISFHSIADVTIVQQHDTTANFIVEKASVDEAKRPDTIIARLIQLNNKTIDEVMDPNSNMIEYFVVTYEVPVPLTSGTSPSERKSITQYGLYKIISPELKAALRHHSNPADIVVRYDVSNPLSLQFIIDNANYDTPLLVTDN